MELISFKILCDALGVTLEQVIEQRRKYRDISYIKKGMASRLDHHLLFSIMSISPLFKIESIFEIGTCAGNCCRMLALLFPKAEITTIDINKDSVDAQNADKLLCNFSNVERLYYDSQLLHQNNNNKYDCIFVDGCHKNPVVSSDIAWAYKYSRNIVVFDDVGYAEPDVVKELLALEKNISEKIYLLETSAGLSNLGLIIKDELCLKR